MHGNRGQGMRCCKCSKTIFSVALCLHNNGLDRSVGEQMRLKNIMLLHNGSLLVNNLGLRNTLVEQDHKVWWIFDSIRCEIKSPDLHVEGCLTIQEVM